jgi:DNA-binding transcriptional regulator YhcF (GntR family)
MHSELLISQADPRPLYLQIKEQIRHRVALGDWTAGYEIPSIRALAAELRVSVITIKRAYLELEHEGVIITRQGKGSFIAELNGVEKSPLHDEMREHLRKAAQLARTLGLSHRELDDELREIQSHEESKP